MTEQQQSTVWPAFCRQAGMGHQDKEASYVCTAPPTLLPLWDEDTVSALSHHPAVARLVAIGTLVALQV
jgi:hypothetical protein